MRSEPMVIQAMRLAFFGALVAGTGLAAGALAAPVSADSFPVATDARLGGDDSQTRFVLDLSRKVDLHVFTLADPYRVVLDIPQVNFALPPKTGESGRGLIKAFRFGLVMPGGSRMVFDLATTDREPFPRKTALDSRSARPDLPSANRPQINSGDARPLVALDPGH